MIESLPGMDVGGGVFCEQNRGPPINILLTQTWTRKGPGLVPSGQAVIADHRVVLVGKATFKKSAG